MEDKRKAVCDTILLPSLLIEEAAFRVNLFFLEALEEWIYF